MAGELTLDEFQCFLVPVGGAVLQHLEQQLRQYLPVAASWLLSNESSCAAALSTAQVEKELRDFYAAVSACAVCFVWHSDICSVIWSDRMIIVLIG